MTFAEDEQVVEAFASDGADPAFGVGVRDRRLDGGTEDRDVVGGEDRVERGGELRVPVSDQVADRRWSQVVVDQEVAGLLGDPGAGGVAGDPGQMDAATVKLEEEQYVQPGQPHRVDGEEVAGDDAAGLRV